MNQPLKICLVMQGNENWIGGVQYIKNIVFSLNSLPDEIKSTFELNLLTNETIEPDLYSSIKPYLNNIYYQEEILKPLKDKQRFKRNFFDKIVKRILQPNQPRIDTAGTLLDDFLAENQINFLYPEFYFYDKTYKRKHESAYWIFDFQHKYLPHLFKEDDIKLRDKMFAKISEESFLVVFSSKTAENDFKKFYPQANSKTKVLQFKTYIDEKWYEPEPIEIQKKYYLPDKFFLVSNQFWQHKNHLIIFQALKILQEKSIYPIVVCTGQINDYRNPDYTNKIFENIHILGIAKQVYLLGLIPRLDQIQLMRSSIAVIQPSLFEGWSTVVEDARALGKNIILSDIAVHLEQNPPYSVFFEQKSPDNLAEKMAQLWNILEPGVNLKQEKKAQEINKKEVENFGYQFLEIAQSK